MATTPPSCGIAANTLRTIRYFLPHARRLRIGATLHGVDDQVALHRFGADLFPVRLILVEMRRRVADEVDDLQDACVLRPLDLPHRLVQRAPDGLRRVAAARRLELVELRVHRVEIIGEGRDLRHVVVAAIAVADEREAHLWRWLRGNNVQPEARYRRHEFPARVF